MNAAAQTRTAPAASTRAMLDAAAQTRDLLCAGSSWSADVEVEAARQVYAATVEAVMLRDLNAAQRKAGEPTVDVFGSRPEWHSEQGAYADLSGWILADERQAKWLSAWAQKFLGRGQLEARGDRFFVVTSYASIGE